jgi:predicted metalloprotease with PDZ domain
VRSEAEYKQFLALAAHELFHAWNAKRLRPVEFWTYDYEAENYTSLLWLIEGWTSYYDDLLCLRAGVISVSDYLAALEKAITTMAQGVGRFRLSLEESSFDAWIRLYRPDEDTFNSSQNYYGNGSIAALCTDLTIRSATEGRCSLDDVLRELYADTFTDGRGYTADDVLRIAAGIAGDSVAAEIARFVGGTFDPDLVALFAAVGVRLTWKDRERPHLGLAFQSGTTKVATVIADSPAEIGGLAPGDEVLALDGVRVTSESWQELLGALATVGAPLQVLVASRGLVGQRTVTPKAGRGTAQVALDESASPSQAALRAAWLKTRGPRAEGGAAKNASVRGPEPRPSV